MAWLKFDVTTPEKPEVLAITIALGWDDPDLTVGKLLKVWRWFDQHTVEGNAVSVTPALFDRLIGVSGITQAMINVGWMVQTETGLRLPNFNHHNGITAKDRALTAERVAKNKNKNNNLAKTSAKGNAASVSASVSSALPREEKRREEDINKTHTTTLHPQGCVSNFSENPKTEKFPEKKPDKTPAGEICKALKAAGMPDVSPSHPELLALIDKRVTVDQFAEAARLAVEKKKGFPYMLGIVKGQISEANSINSAPGMPQANWDENGGTIRAKAKAIGFELWAGDLGLTTQQTEPFSTYTARLRIAVMAREAVAA